MRHKLSSQHAISAITKGRTIINTESGHMFFQRDGESPTRLVYTGNEYETNYAEIETEANENRFELYD